MRVREIREAVYKAITVDGLTYREAADQFGVSYWTVKKIKNGGPQPDLGLPQGLVPNEHCIHVQPFRCPECGRKSIYKPGILSVRCLACSIELEKNNKKSQLKDYRRRT